MAVDDKNISYRIYLVAFVFFLMTLVIAFKLTKIQWSEGEYYRKLAKDKSVKNFVIPSNRGNIYSADGSLLATSIPNYTVRFDAVELNKKDFEANIKVLSDSLGIMFDQPSSYFETKLRNARAQRNRYLLIAKGLSYTEYSRLKEFPIFKLEGYKGGIIDTMYVVREHPIGTIAERTIGYERVLENGKHIGKGIEWAFSNYLKGKNGNIVKQKIARGEWKPLRNNNDIEPQDGYDVISTLDVYIQDIAHHALLKSLKDFNADHGSVVVMETSTGKIKAISNLGKLNASDTTYYETQNYAIMEKTEPGSTFKLVDMIALLEDKKVDTSKVYNRNGGTITFSKDYKVVDSHSNEPQIISLARGLEISSNTVLVQAVYQNYKNNPEQFVNRINSMGLNKPLGLSLQGEASPFIPQPKTKNWTGISLPWMAYGYGVSITPMQTLTLYNAIANNGVMVKPQFVSEIKEWDKVIKKYNTEIINPKICSEETVKKLKVILKNVVKKGTAKDLYSKDFSMAGKTGTAQANYISKKDMYYISSFVGFFPVEKPKYSCIVIIHKPNTAGNNFYGADVAGPVFKSIAQKIFTDSPSINQVKSLNKNISSQDLSYENYYSKSNSDMKVIPNLKGMPGMDAVALLENLKIKVRVIGIGKVKKQSIKPGESLNKSKTIIIELS